jgi:hypothetical protein
MGKPATLLEFKTLAQTINAHYWECKGEISRETKSSSSNPPKPSTSNRASSHPSRSRNHRSGQNKSAKPASASTSSTPKAPDLNTKLGKDRKLMAKECQRRFDKKLCLFCGDLGTLPGTALSQPLMLLKDVQPQSLLKLNRRLHPKQKNSPQPS